MNKIQREYEECTGQDATYKNVNYSTMHTLKYVQWLENKIKNLGEASTETEPAKTCSAKYANLNIKDFESRGYRYEREEKAWFNEDTNNVGVICKCGNDKFILNYGEWELIAKCNCGNKFTVYSG